MGKVTASTVRNLKRAFASLCLCVVAATSSPSVARQQPRPQQPPPPPAPAGGQSPTMKRPGKIEVPPARARRSYDRARDATYVNVDIILVARHAAEVGAAAAAGESADGAKSRGKDKRRPAAAATTAPAFSGREVTLTFQLAYRGAHTYDLVAVYVIVESVAPPGAGDKLAGARQLVIGADPYEFTYERADYQTETVTLAGAATAATPPVRRETAAFRVPAEDLPQIANAGRLALKVGAEEFAVRSAQLTELRRTLTAGVDQ